MAADYSAALLAQRVGQQHYQARQRTPAKLRVNNNSLSMKMMITSMDNTTESHLVMLYVHR
jgi:hypothetical protein